MTSLNTTTLFKNLPCCCGKQVSKPFRKIENYQLLKCQRCGLIRLAATAVNPVSFLDDVITGNDLQYWGFPKFFKKYQSIFNFFFQERFTRIREAYPPEGEWLDVGSGYGFWQTFLTLHGQLNFGLEIEKNAFSFALQSGVSLELQSIEAFSSLKKYSVITMCDVLEHVERPDEILQKCYDLLLPGGLLYVQVPNVIGFKFPYGDSLGLPHHLWQFDPKTLMNLLKKEKFKYCQHWTGVQGVISYYELGGPSYFRKFLWALAKYFKRGNRLQVLVRK